MDVAELRFRKLGRPTSSEAALAAVGDLVGLFMNNGQVLGRELVTAETSSGYSATVILPERESLAHRFDNSYVTEQRRRLRVKGVAAPRIRIVGRMTFGPLADRCKRPAWRVLITSFTSISSPLLCGDCFLPVPLYRLPDREPFRRENLRFWAHSWQACESLQMTCLVDVERMATRQISDPKSGIGKKGRELCGSLLELTGIPTYLYLYCYGAESRAREERRRCPLCGGRWLLEEPLQRGFDFKCDRCRLVSNIAWDVR